MYSLRFDLWNTVASAGGDSVQPGMSWAALADGTGIRGTATEACDTASAPAAGAFTLTGTHATIASTAWASSTEFDLTFTSGLRVTDFETLLLSYTAGASPIRDLAQNNLPNFSNTAVTNPSEFLQGAVLLVSAYRASSYILSGSNVTHVTNEVTGTSHATTANPQYSATGLNNRPAFDFNGTTQCIRGTDAAVRACLIEQAAHHVFLVAKTDNDDSSQNILAVANPGVSDARRGFGISSAGAGRHRDVSVNNAGATTTCEGVDGAPTTGSAIYEFFGSTTTTCRINGVIDGLTPGADLNTRAWNPGTTTAAEWILAASATAAGLAAFFDGDLSYALVFPSVLTTGTNSPTNVRSYLYALSGISGV